ncbi:MAG: FlgD immunoglobulin-like domain containing protein [Candidatus Marinimicrobia bacterium]|nr:FlgD immunoglobulin-like domain containing protein [Candidatus Neomarinimicrobiota bacterium]
MLWTVRTDGTGDFTLIQDAIDASSDGDTVLVYPGTYVENINFNGHNIVVGSLFLTTQDTSYISSTIIDGNQAGSVVTFESGEDVSTVLYGFTVTNGNASFGGGIYCLSNSSPVIEHINISNNVGVRGSGLYAQSSNPELRSSRIINNSASEFGGGIYGYGSNILLTNTIISNNATTNSGGAMYVVEQSTITSINSTIVHNTAGEGEAGVFLIGSDFNAINSIIYYNQNYDFVYDGLSIVTIRNSDIEALPRDPNNLKISPSFINGEVGEFNLADYSPCIGFGTDSVQIDDTWYYAPTTDIDGNSRPNPAGSNPDIGAYEHNQPSQRPLAVEIRDGSDADLDVWGQSDVLDVNWTPFIDDGALDYELALGSNSANISNIMDWVMVGSDTATTLTGLSLTSNTNYVVSVRGTDIHSQMSDTTTSDGFIVDLVDPVVSFVNDGALDADLDWQSDNSQLSIFWSGSDTRAVQTYEYSVGTTPGDVNTVVWTDIGTATSVVLTELTLSNVTYYANIRVTDDAGNISAIVSSDGITIDTIDPIAGSVIDGDLDYTGSNDTLAISWSGFSDAGSGLHHYEYALGTTSGDSNIVDWTPLGLETETTIRDLSTLVSDGITYYAAVRAIDSVDNISAFATSDGITIDISIPTGGLVVDGLDATDLDWSNSTDQLHGSWSGFADAVSGVTHYEYAFGTSPNGTDISTWTITTETSVTVSASLVSGTSYYVTVIAYDAVLNGSEPVSSDGIIIDLIDPVIAHVYDGAIDEDLDWQQSDTQLSIFWEGSDSRDLQSFAYSVGNTPGDSNIVAWTDNGVAISAVISDLTLDNAATYYANIRAIDDANSVSVVVTSDGITIDTIDPVTGSVSDGGLDYTGSNDTLAISWSGFSDAGSGLSNYEYALGTSAGAFDIIGWTESGLVTEVTISGLSGQLVDGSTYFASIHALDSVGNISAAASTDGVIVDISIPTGGEVADGSDVNDLDWTNSPDELGGSWTGFLDAISGIDHYQYAFGTTVNGSDVASWTVTEDTSAIITATLESGTTYYISVITYDAVGNASDTLSSDGILVDLELPEITQVDDGALNDDIDWQQDTGTARIFWIGGDTRNLDYYEVSLGTTPGSDNTVAWADVGINTTHQFTGITLEIGLTYYGNVRAGDDAGNISAILSSDGFGVDNTPPEMTQVTDGWENDILYQNFMDSVAVHFNAAPDDYSGIDFFEVSLNSDEASVIDWLSVGADTVHVALAPTLSDGSTYTWTVRVTDVAGNTSTERSSNGFTIDVNPPQIVNLIDGLETDLVWTNSATDFSASWIGSADTVSGTNHFEISFGSSAAATDIMDWHSVNLETDYTTVVSDVSETTTVYANVRGVDVADNTSNVYSSSGITIDLTSPEINEINEGGLVDLDFTGTLDSIAVHWSGTDALAGIEDYQLTLATVAGDSDVVDWHSLGLLEWEVLRQDMNENQSYFAGIRAIDSAGNWAEALYGDGIIPDITAPLTGTLWDGTEADAEFTDSDSSLAYRWQDFSDDICGIDHYLLAVGSSSGGTDVIPLTSLAGVDTVRFEDLNLENTSIYYASIQAIDGVGNISDQVFSGGIQVDIHAGIPLATLNLPARLSPRGNRILYLDLSEPILDYQLSVSIRGDRHTVSHELAAGQEQIIVNINGELSYGDTIGLVLSDYHDLVNLAGEEQTAQTTVAWLGDFNHNAIIDVDDVALFADHWQADSLSDEAGTYPYECGPISGELPLVYLDEDDMYDLKDIMGFTRMWNWYNQESAQLAKWNSGLYGDDLEFTQTAQELIINLKDETRVGRLRFAYDANQLCFGAVSSNQTGTMLLKHAEEDQGILLIDFAFLEGSNQTEIHIGLETADRADVSLQVEHEFLAKAGDILGGGREDITIQAIPVDYALHHNYPNPFNPITHIQYDLPETGHAVISIYDIQGRLVKTLLETEMQAGYHNVEWNGTDEQGRQAATGIYFYRLMTPGYLKTHKMLLLR